MVKTGARSENARALKTRGGAGCGCVGNGRVGVQASRACAFVRLRALCGCTYPRKHPGVG